MKTRYAALAIALSTSFSLGSFFYFKNQGNGGNLADQALLSLIKNDQSGFETFINQGGDLQAQLPVIDKKSLTIAEGMAQFERPEFIKFVQSKKMSFIQQDEKKNEDILYLAVLKNNAEVLQLLIKENPKLNLNYTARGWSLLHVASAQCSGRVISVLDQTKELDWNLRAKDGSTPLTLAADNDCLQALSYWKANGADFKARDGRGLTALEILRRKKDAALVAFAQSFENRAPASVTMVTKEVNFYKKRVIPKDQMVDHSALIEPEIRPEEANETSEFSEFSD